MNNDTICALATANGIGAIGIIRISGEKSFEIVNKVFQGKNLEKADSHTVHYGFIVDGKMEDGRWKMEEKNVRDLGTKNQAIEDEKNIGSEFNVQSSEKDFQLPASIFQPEIIDEVMVSVFRAPKTFTAEDSVEISFHGSPHISKKILEVLIKNGARMAKAGEFTMRAFMNGRIDLSQAESIADLIASENEASRKVALNQLKGGITNEISTLRTDLLNFTSLVELELDFAEEDVEFADRTALKMLLQKTEEKLQSLINSFQYGNAIKNGVNVAIIGKPNAGKSTLLNALLKEERAIVSEIAGTTRDTIEEVLHIKGTAFRLIDTAGLRETADEIEKIGVEKAKEKVSSAKILIYLIDSNTKDFAEDLEMVHQLQREDLFTLVCFTKMDTITDNELSNEVVAKISSSFQLPTSSFLKISAKDKTGIEQLKSELSNYIQNLETQENTIITNQRHYEALQKSLEAVKRVEAAISQSFHTELLAYELRYALEHLGEISGEFTNDEVLGNIFSKFCIGK